MYLFLNQIEAKPIDIKDLVSTLPISNFKWRQNQKDAIERLYKNK